MLRQEASIPSLVGLSVCLQKKSRNRKVSTGEPGLTLLSVEPCNLKEPCKKVEPCEASNITQT